MLNRLKGMLGARGDAEQATRAYDWPLERVGGAIQQLATDSDSWKLSAIDRVGGRVEIECVALAKSG